MDFTTIRRLAIGFLVIAAASTSAMSSLSAQDKPKLADLVAPQAGNKACFARTYDAAHLREHPKQRVTAVSFLLRAQAYDESARSWGLEKALYYSFAMSVQRRGDKRRLRTGGDCMEGEGISCAVDCDGGGVTLEKAAQGDSLLVRLMEPGGILMFSDCDGAGVWLKPGADDKVFRLDKAAASVCEALEKRVLGE
jgi:hypothetical protein